MPKTYDARVRLVPGITEMLIRESDAAAHRAAILTSNRARQAVYDSGRRRTGRMAASIGNQRRGAAGLVTEYEVGSPSKIFEWQDQGVEGPIVPKKAKVLRFQPKGRSFYVYAMSTKGIPAGHFMRTAFKQLRTEDFIAKPGEHLQ